MEQHDLIYITSGDAQEAKTIALKLVEENLVACANVMPNVSSYYKWHGDMQERAETLIIAKTSRPNMPDIIKRVEQLSQDEHPCVISLPVTDGHPDYLSWVYESTL